MSIRGPQRGGLWALPAALFLVILLLWPTLQLVRLSLCRGGGQSGFGIGRRFYEPGTWTGANYATLTHESYFWELLGFTVWLGFVVTAICLTLGYPVAHFIWKLHGRWKLAALAAVILPKLSNLLVTVYGLKLILGDHGPVNDFLMGLHLIGKPILLHQSTAGVVIGKTCLVLPYTILFLLAGLERVEVRLVAAAQGLGAGGWAAFRYITLPLSLPAIATATLISLIWSLGAFISPYFLGSPQQLTLAVDVQRQMFENLNWPRGAAEGVGLLLTLVLLTTFYSLPYQWLRRRYGSFQAE